jgi:hypothetical protein
MGIRQSQLTLRGALADLMRKLHPGGSRTADAFLPVLDVWRPRDGAPTHLLRWMITQWCNYDCPYCPQTHDRHAPKGEGKTAHAFDNYPLEQWLEAFDRHFTGKRLSLVITGGESMIDRKAMVPLLNTLSARDNTDSIRIDTNAWWKPEQYADLDRSKIILMCTFHPSQVTEEKFFERIEAILAAGFRIGMVNYVMNADNLPRYEHYRERMARLGVPLHPNPLWGEGGEYAPADLELLRASLPALDFDYRTGLVSPKDKACLFPSLAWEMDFRGDIHVGCHKGRRGSFFDDSLPALFGGPTPCPAMKCACLDKYSFIEGSVRNTGTNPLAVYGDLLREREQVLQQKFQKV